MRPTDAISHPADWNTTTVGRSVTIKRGVSWSKEQEHHESGEGRYPVIGIGKFHLFPVAVPAADGNHPGTPAGGNVVDTVADHGRLTDRGTELPNQMEQRFGRRLAEGERIRPEHPRTVSS